MLRIVIAFPIVLLFTVAQAASLDAVRRKSNSCAGCHGEKGISHDAMIPNLAGQKELYLEAQLRAFRKGSRKNPVMNEMAESLSDEDIENLAAYFSNMRTF